MGKISRHVSYKQGASEPSLQSAEPMRHVSACPQTCPQTQLSPLQLCGLGADLLLCQGELGTQTALQTGLQPHWEPNINPCKD